METYRDVQRVTWTEVERHLLFADMYFARVKPIEDWMMQQQPLLKRPIFPYLCSRRLQLSREDVRHLCRQILKAHRR